MCSAKKMTTCMVVTSTDLLQTVKEVSGDNYLGSQTGTQVRISAQQDTLRHSRYQEIASHYRCRKGDFVDANLPDKVRATTESLNGVFRRVLKEWVGANQLTIVHNHPLPHVFRFEIGTHLLVCLYLCI